MQHHLKHHIYFTLCTYESQFNSNIKSSHNILTDHQLYYSYLPFLPKGQLSKFRAKQIANKGNVTFCHSTARCGEWDCSPREWLRVSLAMASGIACLASIQGLLAVASWVARLASDERLLVVVSCLARLGERW